MKRLATFAATLLTLVALLASSSACIWVSYQPEEPESLRLE